MTNDLYYGGFKVKEIEEYYSNALEAINNRRRNSTTTNGTIILTRFDIPITNDTIDRLISSECFQDDTCMEIVICMLNECRKEDNIRLLKKGVKPIKVLYWSSFLLATIYKNNDVMRTLNWLKKRCCENGVGFFDVEKHIMYANVPNEHWMKFHINTRLCLILIEDSYLQYSKDTQVPISTDFHKQNIVALQYLLEMLCIYTCGMSLQKKTGKAAMDWGKGFLQTHQQADGWSCFFRCNFNDIHDIFGEPNTSANYASITRGTELDRKLMFYWICRGIIAPKDSGCGDPQILNEDYYPDRLCSRGGCTNVGVVVRIFCFCLLYRVVRLDLSLILLIIRFVNIIYTVL